ncbi:hypothetical protein [Pseudonocardia sp. ICBG601]|uniref:hypothetical protein n=1 Tax=Pseudonocardia sp. ICBG601 TaxID=2846759 RepID=UPI001CF60B21|nr:hypothetical protein [Pseudonocardia sp. ICBG601]
MRALGGADVVLDTVGEGTLKRSPLALALADLGCVVSIVDTPRPQTARGWWGGHGPGTAEWETAITTRPLDEPV